VGVKKMIALRRNWIVWRTAKWLLITTGAIGILALIVLVYGTIRALLEANDRIDRCMDETSGVYIWNDEERAKACAPSPRRE
jgi:hypothetical protein